MCNVDFVQKVVSSTTTITLDFCHHLLLMGNYPFCIDDTSDDSWGLEGVVISLPNSYFVMAGRQYRNWQFTTPIAFSSTVAMLSRRRGFPNIRDVSWIGGSNFHRFRHMQWCQQQNGGLWMGLIFHRPTALYFVIGRQYRNRQFTASRLHSVAPTSTSMM